ncbi:unnamed protein product [Auanema sp. JU1783]|nr:unnamed protein product [Auanema sp. JU1783]
MKACFESDKFELLYRKGVQCIPHNDYIRLKNYHHREDVLAGLIGKLLLFSSASKLSEEPWNIIEFKKTDKGKPYLSSPINQSFGLNISHQGDFVVFASSCSSQVGVDVMRINSERNNMSADEYINSMAQSASKNELVLMRTQPTDIMKMTVFYRIWCLKEAVLKATGEGIMKNLDRLDFNLNTSSRYRQGCFIKETFLKEDDVNQDQWIFEESFVDASHVVAVCRDKKMPRQCRLRDDEAKIFFSKITLETLLEGAQKINTLPDDGADAYAELMARKKKTF